MPMNNPSVVSGGGNSWQSAAFSTSAVLSGTSRYASQQVTGPIAFSVSGTPVAGGTAYYKLTANGANTPTFTGMVAWGGSAGWVNTAGTINSIAIWYDGETTYYSITQNASAPITQPSVVSAAKSGATSPGTITITLSSAVANTGDTAPDPAAFAITTTNVGAQAETVSAATASAGTTVTLTTTRAAVPGDTTTVSYNPALGALGKRLVDASGNLLFSWRNAPVSVVTFAGMLDGLGVSAAGAWGLRRLASSYTGSLIQVAGSVQGIFDVGYVSATGDLDTSRLTGAAGETYTLVKLYDQSGNVRDQGVTYSGSAPSIPLTGGPKTGMQAYIQNSGSATIKYVGTSLESVFLGAGGRQGSAFVVQSVNTSGPFLGSVGGSNAADSAWWAYQMSTDNNTPQQNICKATLGTGDFISVSPTLGNTNFKAISLLVTSGNAVILRVIRTSGGVKNTEASGSGSMTATPTSLTKWGLNAFAVSNNSKFVEQVQFASDVGTSLRDVIEDNQRLYWGV